MPPPFEAMEKPGLADAIDLLKDVERRLASNIVRNGSVPRDDARQLLLEIAEFNESINQGQVGATPNSPWRKTNTLFSKKGNDRPREEEDTGSQNRGVGKLRRSLSSFALKIGRGGRFAA